MNSEKSRKDANSPPMEVSVVIPCLNEEETIRVCVEKALAGIAKAGTTGEVIVADNGSTDRSREIAQEAGARIVAVSEKGYGAALLGGIADARGQFVIMGDADDSYDFLEIPRFLEPLRKGFDLAQGCRLPTGGGRIEPGAMPILHQYLGNPGFALLGRWWFKLPVNDMHCGMRGFRRELPTEIGLQCLGMEFASEMLIKAQIHGKSMFEIPITLHKDGRITGKRHLRTFRDGWRHLRFYLLFSPTWLFLLPGFLLVLLGFAGIALALPGLTIRGVEFDVSTLLVSTLAVILGYQSLLFGWLTRVYGTTQGLFPADPNFERIFKVANLERGILVGMIMGGLGVVLLGWAVVDWIGTGLGPLDYRVTLRRVIPGSGLTVLGLQTVLASFFFSLLGLKTR